MAGSITKVHSLFRWLLAAFVIVLAVLFIVGLRGATTSSAQPKVTWSDNHIEVTLSPGERTSKDITIASNRDLQNAIVTAVPKIAGFLSLQPNSFAFLSSGKPNEVHISFVIPSGTALGTYEGTVHIKIGSQTLPQTLKISVKVAWAIGQLGVDGANVSFQYPIDWAQFSETPTSVQLFSASANAALADGARDTPANITLELLDNQAGL